MAQFIRDKKQVSACSGLFCSIQITFEGPDRAKENIHVLRVLVRFQSWNDNRGNNVGPSLAIWFLAMKEGEGVS